MKNFINVTIAFLITGGFTLNAQIIVATDGKIGLCGITSPISHLQLGNNQWQRFSAPSGKAGLLFYEAYDSYPDDVQYGARIFYNADQDRFNIVTKQNNADVYGITILRTYGRVGIAMNSNPGYPLDVNGWIRCVGLTETSDIRLKTDVKNLDKTSVSKIMNLKAITYKPVLKPFYEIVEGTVPIEGDTLSLSLDKVKEKEQSTKIGFIAQEVREYYPELIQEDDEGYLSINYTGLIPILVEAFKEQQLRIEELELEVTKLSKLQAK
jgi:hypothetical protein